MDVDRLDNDVWTSTSEIYNSENICSLLKLFKKPMLVLCECIGDSRFEIDNTLLCLLPL